MPSTADKTKTFAGLHQGPGLFIMPNPWDIGTARLLESKGFKALATTSAGFDNAEGRCDGEATRDQALAHARELASAVDVPVSGDFLDCFERTPEGVAQTIRLASQAGLAGCSIEDVRSQGEGDKIYSIDEAADRVRAAAEAAASLPDPFILTARAENFLHGRKDLEDTVKRLQAYQAAGAGALYAPGLSTREEISAVVSSVDLPVNVLMAGQCDLTAGDLEAMGVRRISVGSALFRAAFAAALSAADEMVDHGTFTFAKAAAGFGGIASLVTR